MNIVLLDLDKTLIDPNYKLNVPESVFCDVIKKLLAKDTIVGLCSDSSVLTLNQWANRLGLTGPIVAERGSVIWNPVLNKKHVVNATETAWLQTLRSEFLSKAMDRFPETTFIIGDATEFIRRGSVFPSMTHHVVVINGFRSSSFSFFARSYTSEGSPLIPDASFLIKLSNLTKEIISSFGKTKEDLFWDENPEYGILIVHAKETEKHRGVTHLFSEYQPNKIIMVGDSIADYLNLSNVLQYAVGNADQTYKEKCDFVATHSYTQGVIECLEKQLN